MLISGTSFVLGTPPTTQRVQLDLGWSTIVMFGLVILHSKFSVQLEPKQNNYTNKKWNTFS